MVWRLPTCFLSASAGGRRDPRIAPFRARRRKRFGLFRRACKIAAFYALPDEPAPARKLPPQPARVLVVLDLSRPVRRLDGLGVPRQRSALDRLLQGRDSVSRLRRL